jgi:hypothetical protein
MSCAEHPPGWRLTLAMLLGHAIPPLPAHRGSSVHRLEVAADDEELSPVEDLEPEFTALPSGVELARLLGITRAGALHRLSSVRHLPLEQAMRELLKAPQRRHRTGAQP